MRKFTKFLLLILVSLVLISCGFHLRDNLNFPPQLDILYISSATPYGKFEQYLKNILRTSDINIVEDPEDAHYMLRINTQQMTQSMTSISLNTQTRAYNLHYEVGYDLVYNGVTILSNQIATGDQSYITSASQISFSNDAQMKTTVESLQHTAAEQIINRLSSEAVKKIINRTAKSTSKITLQ